jgi:hypothetical protein
MKNIGKLALSLILLLSTMHIQAQFGNNGFGNQMGGMNQRGGINQMGAISQATQPEKPKEIPPAEIVAMYMKDMQTALTLDELQNIAISNELLESFNAHGRITKLNLSEESLINEYKALSETTDRKIMNFLNKDQKEKYLIFKEQAQQPKKSKSKEKKKSKKSEENKEK